MNLGINRQSLCGNALRSVLSIVYNWFPSDINFQFHKLHILYLLLKKETVKGAINVTVSIRKPSFHTCPNVGTKPFDYCLLGRIQRRSRAQSNPTPPTISLTQFGTPCSPLIFTHSYSLSYTSFNKSIFTTLNVCKIVWLVAKSEDPDQMPRSAVSDLDLHCLSGKCLEASTVIWSTQHSEFTLDLLLDWFI